MAQQTLEHSPTLNYENMFSRSQVVARWTDNTILLMGALQRYKHP
jgi:hypothetical protein